MRESQIARMEFEPYTFGLTPLAQTIIFILYELFHQLVFPERFEKELFKVAEDGGTLGLDWDGGIPSEPANNSEP